MGEGPTRVRSVDALRGAVVALMVFVNGVADAPGVPGWTQHLPAAVDGYTVTDMVLPWFLFLVGVSLPLSLGKHLGPGGIRAAAARVLPRVAGLLVLGLVDVNLGRHDPDATGLGASLWLGLVLVCALVLFKMRDRTASPRRQQVERIAKVVAAVGLAVLLAIWRGRDGGGGVSWFERSWWGILGIIGWAYLVGAFTFLVLRGNPTALVGALGLFVCVAIGTQHDRLGILRLIDPLLDVHSYLGSMTALVVAGALAGRFLRDGRAFARTATVCLFGAGLWAAGWLLRPLHGYHKIAATESWALVAAGQGALLLAGFHLAFDRPARPWDPLSRWAVPWLALAGQNALLAYLLPSLLDAFLGVAGLELHPFRETGGARALAGAAVVAVIVVSGAALASWRRVMIRL